MEHHPRYETDNFKEVADQCNEHIARHAEKYFPKLGFKQGTNPRYMWQSHLKFDGSTPKNPKSDKTVVLAAPPFCIREWGEQYKLPLYALSSEKGYYGNTIGSIMEQIWRDKTGEQLVLRGVGNAENEGLRQFSESYEIVHLLCSNAKEYESEVQSILAARGWDKGFFNFAHLGYLKPDDPAHPCQHLLQRIEETFSVGVKPSQLKGDEWLVIPMKADYRYVGLIFRNADPRAEKGRRYFKAYLPGLSINKEHAQGIEQRRPDTSLLIVEGDLDALRMQWLGYQAVAVGNATVTEGLAAALKAKGHTSAVLMLDTDEHDNDPYNADKAGRELTSFERLKSAGIDTYVVHLIPSVPGEKADPDSVIKGMDRDAAKRKIKEVIDGAFRPTEFLLWHASKTKTKDNSKEEYFKILAMAPPTERDPKGFEAVACYLDSTPEAVRTEYAQKEEESRRKATTEARAKTASDLTAAIRKGDKKAEATLLRRLQAPQADPHLWPTGTDPRVPYEIRVAEDRQRKGLGMGSGIYGAAEMKRGHIQKETYVEQLLFRPGSISLFSAPTSHGKTTILKNLLCNVLFGGYNEDWGKEPKHRALFLTTEDEYWEVYQDLLRMYAGQAVPDWVMGEYIGGRVCPDQGKWGGFWTKADEIKPLFGKYIFIEDATGSLDEANAFIDKAVADYGVDIVFYDNAQDLSIEGATKKEAIGQSLLSLGNTIRTHGVALVMASQLNRQAGSPYDISLNRNADATELERKASLAVTMWNCKFRPTPDVRDWDDKYAQSFTAETGLNVSRDKGDPGWIYCRIEKNRKGESPLVVLLNFDKETGRIIQPQLFEEDKDGKANPRIMPNTNALMGWNGKPWYGPHGQEIVAPTPRIPSKRQLKKMPPPPMTNRR